MSDGSAAQNAAHLTELRELAEAATPGPWAQDYGPDSDWGAVRLPNGTSFEASHDRPQMAKDAAFIAASDPAVVLALLTCFKRAVFLAEHLHAMVPQQVWRDSGGDDQQGHYEGDYRAEQVADELKALAGLFSAPDVSLSGASSAGSSDG